MIYAIIHHRSAFTGAAGNGAKPVRFLNAADADAYMRELNRAYPGIVHTWKLAEKP